MSRTRAVMYRRSRDNDRLNRLECRLLALQDLLVIWLANATSTTVPHATCRLIPCSFFGIPYVGLRNLQPESWVPKRKGCGMSLQVWCLWTVGVHVPSSIWVKSQRSAEVLYGHLGVCQAPERLSSPTGEL